MNPCVRLFRERTSDLLGLAESFRPLLVASDQLTYTDKDVKKHFTAAGGEHLKALSEIFARTTFSAEALEAALNAYVADNGLRFKEVAPPLRTALMGFMGGSHLNEIMAFLGQKETLARLSRACEICQACQSV